MANILRIALMLLVVGLAIYLAITLFFIFLIVLAIGIAYVVVMRLFGKSHFFSRFQKANSPFAQHQEQSREDNDREGIIIEHEQVKNEDNKP